MNKINRILQEFYLYDNKIEMVIKILIWTISWIGGILILQDKTATNTLASAYFIFSLSLLMEFIPQISSKKEFVSKLLHTFFCIIILFLFLMSINLLLGSIGNEKYYNNMFILSIVVIIYMVINFLCLWLIGEGKIKETANENSDENDVNLKKAQQLFQDKLFNGNLGNINKGENNE